MEHESKVGEGRIVDLSTLGEPMFKTGFDRFWEAWPKSTRKGAKAECKKKWVKNYCETCADQIIKHVEWMKTTDQWRKNEGAFIPAPLVYLNQQRWDGAEIPEIKPTSAKDPALVKLDEDTKKAAPMPESVRQRLAELRKGT
jgi:hypothetical protein